MKLTVKNHAQPFLRVSLPAGATVLSAEVEGQGVKPAMGDGGTRIPLLRPGFRPSGSYEVTFVYLQTADAFVRRGDGRLTLPRMDIPIGLVNWEVFLPDQLQVRDFAGNAAKEHIWEETYPAGMEGGVSGGVEGGTVGGVLTEVCRVGPRARIAAIDQRSTAIRRFLPRGARRTTAEARVLD